MYIGSFEVDNGEGWCGAILDFYTGFAARTCEPIDITFFRFGSRQRGILEPTFCTNCS